MIEQLMLSISQFHFLRPFWLLMLIPCALIVLILWRQHRPEGSWKNAIAPALLQHLLHQKEQKLDRTPLRLLMMSWMLATIAIAGPSWETQPTPVSKSEQPLVIVVDLSWYMLAEDVKPDRMARARYKLQDLIRLRQDGVIALVSYAGSAHIVSPLTDDDPTLINLAKALNPTIMPVQGNKPAEAIKLAIDLLKQGSSDDGEILLVTGTLSSTQQNKINEILDDSNIRLSVLGIGTAQGAPIPLPDGGYLKDDQGSIIIPQLAKDKLTQLAKTHRGVYRDMSVSDNDLKALLPKAIFEDDVVLTEKEFDQWHDAGYWLILLLLPLALAGFRRGWLTALLIALILPATPDAMAMPLGWSDLWQTRNQQAQQQLKEGDAAKAAELFTDTRWQAQAYFQNQQFEEAANLFGQKLSFQEQLANDAYNQGNALAKASKLPEALKAYEQALTKQPDFEDAQFNKNIVEQMLKQQEQQKQNQDNQEKEKKEQEKKEQEKKEQEKKEQEDQQSSDQQQDQNQDQNQDQQNTDQKNSEQQNQQDAEQQNSDQSEQQKQQSAEQEKEQQQKEQQKQEVQQGKPDDDKQQAEKETTQQIPVDQDDQASTPEKQAVESWLRTIPDDPGGLLRRKFLQQQQQRGQVW